MRWSTRAKPEVNTDHRNESIVYMVPTSDGYFMSAIYELDKTDLNIDWEASAWSNIEFMNIMLGIKYTGRNISE